MKACFKCGAEKPLTEFYKQARMADGHLNHCKECKKKDVRQNREENVEYYRQYDRDRGYREYDAKKAKARLAVRSLKRPECCTWCGNVGKVEGHHPDYDKPLSVVWLCKPCHVACHTL